LTPLLGRWERNVLRRTRIQGARVKRAERVKKPHRRRREGRRIRSEGATHVPIGTFTKCFAAHPSKTKKVIIVGIHDHFS
jgi:hypothetical protein